MDGVVAGEACRGSGPRIRGCRRRARRAATLGGQGALAVLPAAGVCTPLGFVQCLPAVLRAAGATQCEKLAVKREKVVDIRLSGAIIYGLQKCSKGIRSAAKDSWHRKV